MGGVRGIAHGRGAWAEGLVGGVSRSYAAQVARAGGVGVLQVQGTEQDT